MPTRARPAHQVGDTPIGDRPGNHPLPQASNLSKTQAAAPDTSVSFLLLAARARSPVNPLVRMRFLRTISRKLIPRGILREHVLSHTDVCVFSCQMIHVSVAPGAVGGRRAAAGGAKGVDESCKKHCAGSPSS